MNKVLRGLIFLVILWLPVAANAEGLFNKPESVSFDSLNNRYFVMNVGDSSIVSVDADGVQDYFYLGHGWMAGSEVVGETLYVSCNYANGVKYLLGFDLTGDTLAFQMEIPANGNFDGLAADTSGYLYGVDTSGRIFRIRISDRDYAVFANSGLVNGLQTCAFDVPNNRLFAVEWYENAPIKQVNLISGAVSVVATTTSGFFDGITVDHEGYVYVASYSENGCVYRYDPTFTEPPFQFSAGHGSPSGIDYNPRDLVLAVPCFYVYQVYFYSDIFKADPDEDGLVSAEDNCPETYNPGQEDGDGDGAGNDCDNCAELYNPDQADIDGDGIGDNCEVNRSWHVRPDGSGDATTIQDGIDISTHGDTVVIADGTYTGAGENVFDFGGRRILFRSENGPQTTIIDCQGSDTQPRRACTLDDNEDAELIIDGFTIRNGYGPLVDGSPTGGGMMFRYSSPTVKNCVFSNNYGLMGGAAFARDAAPHFINCTFADNEGAYGAALAGTFYGNYTLENCIVAFNGPGEGVYCYGSGSADLFCCDVFGNTGGDWTGCLYGQGTSEGNFSADPEFCSIDFGDFGLHDEGSPCMAPNNSCGVLIGACVAGCSCNCTDHCDLNLDDEINPVDVVYMVNFVYKSLDGREPIPGCVGENGDWNCDEQVNPVDVVYYVNFVYKSFGTGPCDPCDGEG